jgi:hypothetical protein
MKKRYIIHFNPTQTVCPIGPGWKILNAPPDEEIFSVKKKQFEDCSVVLLIFSDHERSLIISAARELLAVASEVKIVNAVSADAIDEQQLAYAPAVPDALLDMDDEDFASLAETPTLQAIHQAQDYYDGVMFYGTINGRQDRIVTSANDYFTFAAAKMHGINLMQPQLSMSQLRRETVIKFFSGGLTITPDAIFETIRDYIRRHIYFPDPETYDLVTVWIMGTYIFRAFRYYPYLHLNAEKGSGKTLLMELMAPVSFNGILLTQPVVSTVIKLIDQSSATLFIDEAEGLSQRQSGGNSQLKQILKTGFARSGLYYVGETMYRTYSPKCFAGINELDDVLADRAVTIKMMRMTKAEGKELYRETAGMRKEQMLMRDSLYLFGLRFGPSIAMGYEAIRPEALYDKLVHLSNRAYDVWLPLYRIVSAFKDVNVQNRAFESLDKLSQLDGARRRVRDAEENETGELLQGLTDVLKSIQPLSEDGGIQYYDPDVVYGAMIKDEKISKSVKKKGFSRLIKRILDIDSVPRAFGLGTKRMYAFDVAKFEEYKKRYSDVVGI